MGPPRVSLSPPSAAPKPSDWRKSSSTTLPPLAPELAHRLEQRGQVEFPTNEECTSLAMVPSGRHVVAGFTDGTLRLFDLTGHFSGHTSSSVGSPNNGIISHDYDLFDSDSSDDDDDDGERVVVKAGSSSVCGSTITSNSIGTGGGSTTALVCSKSHQRYGTVACQIHAKGVHTSLQMTVGVTPDGLYAFGGVARGSMELVAVHLAKLEEHHEKQHSHESMPAGLDMLDLVDVHRHADAKLRGFGACTRLMSCSKRNTTNYDDPTYILLTGKGIKNIHIWSFRPAFDEWKCLYDTQSNGNSIALLHLRYSPLLNKLQAISKSDNQKLRVWDLSHEQLDDHAKNEMPRLKRPPYTDLAGTDATIGIGGDFGFGGNIHDQISLTNLERDAPYNLTELALPRRTGASAGGRRQQRGELKSLHQVAGMSMDASHVLLEMSDQSVVHFYFANKSLPCLEMLPIEATNSNITSGSRTLSLARVGSEGITVAAIGSTYNGKGSIVVRQIGDASSEGYWGFHGIGPTQQKQFSISPEAADSEAIAEAAGSAVNLFATKIKKNSRKKNSCEKTPVVDDSIIPVSSAPLSSTNTPATKRHTIIPDSITNTPPVPASAIKVSGSITGMKGHPLPNSIKKTLNMDGVAVSPESQGTPRDQSKEDDILHHQQPSVTIQIKKKKRKKKRPVATADGHHKESDKPQGTKKLILHIRRPTELESELAPTVRRASIGDSSSKFSSSDKRKPVVETAPPVEKRQAPKLTVLRASASETFVKSIEEKKKENQQRKLTVPLPSASEMTVKSVDDEIPIEKKLVLKPTVLCPSVSEISLKLADEKKKKLKSALTQENQQHKPTVPHLSASEIAVKYIVGETPVEKKKVPTPTVFRPSVSETSMKSTDEKMRSIADEKEKKAKPASTKENQQRKLTVPRLSASEIAVKSVAGETPVEKKQVPKSTVLRPSVSETPMKSTDEKMRFIADEKKKKSKPASTKENQQRKLTVPRPSASETTVKSIVGEAPVEKKQAPKPTVLRPSVSETPMKSTDEKMRSIADEKKKKSKSASSKENQQRKLTVPRPSASEIAVKSVAGETPIAKKQVSKPTVLRLSVSEKPLKSTDERKMKSIADEKKKKSKSASTKENQQRKLTVPRSSADDIAMKFIVGEKKRKGAPAVASNENQQLKPTVLRPGVSETSMRSIGSEKKRSRITTLKRAAPSRMNPAVFVAAPPPRKKSRAVEANMGNVKSVNVAPLSGWEIPSVSKRIGSFSNSRSASKCEDRRIKLVLEHRATHEMIRRKVLESTTKLMQTMDQADPPSAEEVKNSLEDAMNRYSEMLDDHLFRQELEASSLAATLSLPFTPAVSFPFPEVFDQARKTLSIFLNQRKKEV